MANRLLESIKRHEGLRLRTYTDTVGVPTIGYGQNLLTLTIDEPTAAAWLAREVEKAAKFAATTPEWVGLDPVRRDVIVEMIYNLGQTGYAGFVNTRRAIQERRFEDAAQGMLASKWARQVGRRAVRLAEQMKTGVSWLASEAS